MWHGSAVAKASCLEGGLSCNERWLIAWLTPLAILLFIFKFMRVETATMNHPSGFEYWCFVYLSDVLALVAFALLGHSLLGHFKNWYCRRLIQGGSLLYLGLVVLTHGFYRNTGTTLSVEVLVDSFNRHKEVGTVVSAAASASHDTAILLGCAIFLSLLGTLIVEIGEKRAQNVIKSRAATLAQTKPRFLRFSIAAPLAVWLWLVATIIIPSYAVHANLASEPLADFVFRYSDSLVQKSTLEADKRAAGYSKTRAIVSSVGDGTTTETKPPVIFILLESTAYFATSFGGRYDTTPFLNELAKEFDIASSARIVVPHTSKALVTALCGIEPNLRLHVTEAKEDGLSAACIGSLLKAVNYEPVFFQGAEGSFESRPGLIKNLGFPEFHSGDNYASLSTEFEKANYFGLEDAVLLKPIEERLRKQSATSPLLFTLLTNTPHHQYLAPRRYGFKEYVPKRDALNRYLNAIHYQDEFLRELFSIFKKLGLYDDALIVIVGDHGEGFGEHDRYAHDDVFEEAGLNVPLLFKLPAKLNRKMSDWKGQRSQLDILPTILDAIGYEFEHSDFEGSSWLEPEPKGRVLYSSCYHARTCLIRQQGEEKYIYHFGLRKDELFNIVQDPMESKNLIEHSLPDVRAELLAWRDGVRQYVHNNH